jgi:hypothetical protein
METDQILSNPGNLKSGGTGSENEKLNLLNLELFLLLAPGHGMHVTMQMQESV